MARRHDRLQRSGNIIIVIGNCPDTMHDLSYRGEGTTKDKEYMPLYKTWGRSRSIRLKDFDYAASYVAYHITIGSYEKRDIFIEPTINQKIVDILKEMSSLYGYYLLAYCLMPDHLHILLQAGKNPRDLRDFVKGFKSYSTKASKMKLWQRGFYEHILRKEEESANVAEYILNNPVRKEITNDKDEYLWSELLECSVVSPDTTPDRPHRSEDATIKVQNRARCELI
jgi:putative transposase